MCIRLFLLLLTSFFILSSSFAQNEFREKVFQLGLTGGAPIYIDLTNLDTREIESSFSLGGAFHWDFAVLKRFSLGVGISYQKFDRTLLDYRYTSDDNSLVIEDAEVGIRSTSLYFRTLYHFKNLYEKMDNQVDLYWGVGYTGGTYRFTTESASPELRVFGDNFDQSLYAVAGVRYYPSDRWGFHVETSFPSNYFLSVGVNYRIEWQMIRLR